LKTKKLREQQPGKAPADEHLALAKWCVSKQLLQEARTEALEVLKIDAAPALTVISFRPNPPVDAMKIIELVQKNRHIKLAGNDKLRIERATPAAKDRAQTIRDVLRALGQPTGDDVAAGNIPPARPPQALTGRPK
jgi:hypothetical protein